MNQLPFTQQPMEEWEWSDAQPLLKPGTPSYKSPTFLVSHKLVTQEIALVLPIPICHSSL